MVFEPDIFSVNYPKWEKVNHPIPSDISVVISNISSVSQSQTYRLECSISLNINSNNYRLISSEGIILLKRWGENSNIDEIKNNLEIMLFVSNYNLPVPKPLEFIGGDILFSMDGKLWSAFTFIDGEYFYGNEAQLSEVAKTTGCLMNVLKIFPNDQYKKNELKYFDKSEFDYFKYLNDYLNKWDEIIENDIISYLYDSWSVIYDEWVRLSNKKIITGSLQLAHMDLHPHNILINNNKVVGILDFESCRLMPVGYALAYAALKQCRQYISSANLNHNEIKKVGDKYINILLEVYEGDILFFENIADLSISEALRRIHLILKLNINNKVDVWNKVLPIQIRHIHESKVLFSNYKI